MPPPLHLRLAMAIARSAAFGLGLGGVPWLGTYVLGRDLASRAAGWLTPVTVGRGRALSTPPARRWPARHRVSRP
jgi:hypothetical protein